MSDIDPRRSGMNNPPVYDRELARCVCNDRNRRVARWAADRMGLARPAADAYVRAVAGADPETCNDADVQRRVAADLARAGVAAPLNLLRAVMDRLHEAAWAAAQTPDPVADPAGQPAGL